MTDENIFEGRTADGQKLLSYGFTQTKDGYSFSTPIADGAMRLTVAANADGVRARVIDPEWDEEYRLHLVDEAQGAFVGKVRQDYERILLDIRDKCFPQPFYRSDLALALAEHILATYGDEAEHPFTDDLHTTVWRRQDTKKWYAVLLSVNKKKLGLCADEVVESLLLHITPEELDRIVDGKKYFRGYHMNKRHWLTVLLDGSISPDELFARLATSHALGAKPKKKG